MNKYLILSIILLRTTFLFGQDTLVGWTFPLGTKNQLANEGNALNKGGMYLEAAKINEMPFDTIKFFYQGYTTLAASSDGWNEGKEQKCWKISCDATGYEKMKLYCRISSDSLKPGPRYFSLQYRLGCCSPDWHDIPDAFVHVNEDWTTGVMAGIDIPNDAKDMPGLQIRWLCYSDTATDGSPLTSSGVSLIDDIYITASAISGIKDEKGISKTSVFPNPFINEFTITCSKTDIPFQVFDSKGKMIISRSTEYLTDRVNLENYPSGMYFVKVCNQEEVHLYKMLKF